MNPFRRGTTQIAYLTGIALVIIAVGIEYFQFHQNQQFLLTDLKNRLIEHTANVNLRARTVKGYVIGLKTAAENSLNEIKQFGMKSPLYAYLKNDLPTHTYFLDRESLTEIVSGNLRGKGTLEGLSQQTRNELNMALSLNPFFENALKGNRGTVWVYYASLQGFQNVYPAADGFSSIPPPQEKRNTWTPIHDRKEQGLVVTNSSPVSEGEKQMGTVSLDLSLTELDRVMNRIQDLEGRLYLINKDHQVLATKGVHSRKDGIPTLDQFLSQNILQKIDAEIKSPSGWFVFEGQDLIFVTDLHETPWTMIYVGSRSSLFLQVFAEALENLFLISLLLIFVVGLGYLIVLRNFITPAGKLVTHISNENKGIKSNPSNLPSRWRPWFEIVTKIFTENRTLLDDLENRVYQRTKELEEALIHLKKAQNQIIVQEKLASLGALTAGIAHEIKNPLNFIINFSELSLEYLHELKEKVKNEPELLDLALQNVTKTIEHAHRADAIVKSMLAHARGSTGEITTFNLNALLKQSIELGYNGFLGSNAHFTAKIVEKFDAKVGEIQGSEQDLARVFLNIINNACFALFDKKKKEGKGYKPELNIETKDAGNLVKITIEDNGPGMDKAVLKKVFTPFFTTKESGKGTGLGLSLSYDIIAHQHKGHLSVESEVGKFTRFIIELPKGGGQT